MNNTVAKLQKWPYPVQILLLAALYFGTARVGLEFAFVQKSATPVWPPTGIALAALLLFGTDLWPGVALGAFLANLSNNTPFLPSLAICTGNTLEALIAVYLLNHVARMDTTFKRTRDVIGFVGLGAGASPVVSATIGVTALCATGLQLWTRYLETWWVWWLGDAMGTMVVATVLLTWGTIPLLKRDGRRIAEACILLALSLGVSLIAYSNLLTTINYYPLAYFTFPFLIWAAIRFNQREVVTLNLIISAIAVWDTAREAGPFVGEAINESILSLAGHISMAQVTAMLIAATLAERRQAEAEIRQLNVELEQRVRERTAEISTVNKRLTELDRLKSKFITDASHEMRTPLTIANTDAYLLEHGKPEKREQYLSELRSQIGRLTRFADTILDASHLDLLLAQGKVTFGLVDLNVIVEKTITTFAPHAEALGLRLTFTLAPELPPIHAAPNQISQVVIHLMANAISNTPEGEIAVSTGANAELSRVLLQIRDTGRGIHPEDLPHIFERFYRGQGIAESNIPGTGLGLAITQEIVNLHSGSIEAQSEVGKGSTFTVWLPVKT